MRLDHTAWDTFCPIYVMGRDTGRNVSAWARAGLLYSGRAGLGMGRARMIVGADAGG